MLNMNNISEDYLLNKLVSILDGIKRGDEYRLIDETIKTFRKAKIDDIDNVVFVYGASDDLMEFHGAIYDEIDAWEGTTVYINECGLLKMPEDCDNYHCKYLEQERRRCKTIDAFWCKEDGYTWTYKTDIPHVIFNIIDDDDDENHIYCRGIIFLLNS